MVHSKLYQHYYIIKESVWNLYKACHIRTIPGESLVSKLPETWMAQCRPEVQEILPDFIWYPAKDNGVIPFTHNISIQESLWEDFQDWHRVLCHECKHVEQYRRGHLPNLLHNMVANQLLLCGLYGYYLQDVYEKEARNAEPGKRSWMDENATMLFVQELAERQFLSRFGR